MSATGVLLFAVRATFHVVMGVMGATHIFRACDDPLCGKPEDRTLPPKRLFCPGSVSRARSKGDQITCRFTHENTGADFPYKGLSVRKLLPA